MSISERKLEANRENAQKSTGPQSIEMKEKVSQNAVKHGLCGKFQLLPFEKQADFDNLVAQFMADEKPVGSTEVELVVKMAEFTWLSKRALRMQHSCYAMEPATEEQKARGEHPVSVSFSLERYIRYQTSFDRAYQRASKDLRERRKERQLEERGFVSQKQKEAEEQRKIEQHSEVMKGKKVRRQLDEIKVAEKLAKILPPDFPGFANPQAFGVPNLPFSTDATPARP